MQRNAFLFVAVSLLSGFGSTVLTLAAAVWILDLSGSVSLAGLGGLAVYAPVLAAPWLGALVDRLPRRRLLITANVLLAGVLLALVAVRSAGEIWLIFAVLLTRGVGYVILGAGESALLPASVPAEVLADVNGWRSSAQEGMKLIGPVAGAGLYAWQGGAAVAAVSAATALGTADLYAALHRLDDAAASPASHVPPVPRAAPASRRPSPSHRRPRRGSSRVGRPLAGLAVWWRAPAVRTPVTIAATAIAASGFTTAAVYSRVTDGIGLPPAFLGVLGSAQGAGSLVAGLMVGRLLARAGATTVAAAGAALFAAGCLGWMLPWWPATIAGSMVVGVGLPWALIAAIVAVQTHTPAHLLGRASATADAAMFGPIAVANPLGAAVVHLGAYVPLVLAALVVPTVAVLVVRPGRW
ncbi:MFS transporter [Mangrovihabitans endophyticus]|uniref:MFS transporter n=1 Tax=Mangrovihabitans endophyticus TaxID=1751298 RepID=A0A8J3BR99_9ACTN|nr:MFS transporter [Mangrovihabitans endophyticus]GGK70270.1 MFS transporter [Mangrovihabitans endophyticus]